MQYVTTISEFKLSIIDNLLNFVSHRLIFLTFKNILIPITKPICLIMSEHPIRVLGQRFNHFSEELIEMSLFQVYPLLWSAIYKLLLFWEEFIYEV